MKCLLDTHTLLWFARDEPNLPAGLRSVIEDPENDISVSIASFWEIAIKNSVGNLPLPIGILGLEAQANAQNIDIAPITIHSIQHLTQMPEHHKDPFDRIIAATAITTGQTLLSIDSAFDAYGVTRMWQ